MNKADATKVARSLLPTMTKKQLLAVRRLYRKLMDQSLVRPKPKHKKKGCPLCGK